MIDDPEFDRLMESAGAYLAELREEHRKAMPALKARELNLKTFIADIEKHPSILFGVAPPLPGGGHARLLPKEEVECGKAVIAVLKKRLALVYRAMGAEREAT